MHDTAVYAVGAGSWQIAINTNHNLLGVQHCTLGAYPSQTHTADS